MFRKNIVFDNKRCGASDAYIVLILRCNHHIDNIDKMIKSTVHNYVCIFIVMGLGASRHQIHPNHSIDVKWPPTHRLIHRHIDCLFSSLFNLTLKGNIKAPYHWHFLKGIHRWPMDSPHKGPVMRKLFPFHDVIIRLQWLDLIVAWHRFDTCMCTQIPLCDLFVAAM